VHFFMGGVRLKNDFRTSIEGLFAAGEVVGGTHGANRLGGNALAESFVFGSLAGSRAAQFVQKSGKKSLFQERRALQEWNQMRDTLQGIRGKNLSELETELQSILGDCLGVIRHQGSLERGWGRLQSLRQSFVESDFRPLKSDREILAFRSKILMAEMILRSALIREETRGAHVREDFPDRDDKHWLRHICIKKETERMDFFLEPVHPG
jgi:succinate dehydrogenase/fumarate reductase flavoprotein subunit